ncbi:MAG: hypothetical protein U0441_21780 [Polyangiaceae bacterium]
MACAPSPSVNEDLGEARQAALSENALSENALSENALSENALSENALSENALVGSDLAQNPLVTAALEDPKARELYKYIVSCALPADAHIDQVVNGVTYGFEGGLGLAPEWGEIGGSCDAECRSWVSACVIARLDYLGQPLQISLRGDHEALATTKQERKKFDHVEATYYGDIFTQPMQVYGCLPPGKIQIPRVCGPSINDCVVDVQGFCPLLCDPRESDGAYPGCREAPTFKKNGGIKLGTKHVGSITVFLQ